MVENGGHKETAVAGKSIMHKSIVCRLTWLNLSADLAFYRLANGLGPLLQGALVPALKEQTRLGLGAGIAQQHAAALGGEFGFRIANKPGQIIDLFKWPLFANQDISDELGEAGPTFGETRQRLSTRFHNAKDLQSGDNAVAGRAQLAKDEVSALLAAEAEIVAQHFINDVLVTDGGTHDAAAGGLQSGIQTRVAHDGGDQCFFVQRILGEQIQSGDSHNVVAIDQAAAFIT